MSKFPVAFHENCLRNLEKNLVAEEQALVRQTKRVENSRRDIARLRGQIARAINESRDGFDPDRFLPRGTD